MHKLGFLGIGLIIISLIVWGRGIIKKDNGLYSGLYKSISITLIVIGLVLILLQLAK